jgi:hypothetical protein
MCNCQGKGTAPPWWEPAAGRPRSEYRQIEISDSGARSDEWSVGELEASPLGWEVQAQIDFADESASVFAIQLRITVRGSWQSSGTLTYEGIDFGSGGRIYVPAPSFSLDAIDRNGDGNGEVARLNLYAAPRHPAVDPLGSSVMYGHTGASVAAGATEQFTVPAGASGYRVIADPDATGPLTVSEINASGTVGGYVVDPSASYGPPQAAGDYRRIPPRATRIDVLNGDVAEQTVAVQWRIDLRGAI